MATAAKRLRLTRAHDVARLAKEVAAKFVEHRLLVYAAATAFQAFVALVPLTMLLLGLFGAFGLKDVWRESVAPALEGRVSGPVYRGIDHTVLKIVSNGDAALIAFALLLSVWYLTNTTRSVMEALDRIHDVKDPRPFAKRIGIAAALGTFGGSALVGSALLIAAGPRADGAVGFALGFGRWIVAVALIWVVVALLLRYAPAEHPSPKWASAGAALIVGGWLAVSVLFSTWLTYFGEFTTPIRSLTGLLVITSYLYVSALIFLAGAQLDEILRENDKA